MKPWYIRAAFPGWKGTTVMFRSPEIPKIMARVLSLEFPNTRWYVVQRITGNYAVYSEHTMPWSYLVIVDY